MAEAAGDIFGPINAETNDLIQFDATAVDASNTLVASDTYKLHGNYSYKITFGGDDEAYGQAALTEKTEIYTRMYFRIDTLSLADNEYLVPLRIRDGTSTVVQIQIIGTGTAGQYGCRAYFRDNSTLNLRYNAIDSNIFQDDTDFYIEVHWKQGNGNGVEEFWIDGVSKYSSSAITNTNYAIDQARYGALADGTNIASGIFYFDDIIGNSTGPIGAYAESGGTSKIPLMMAYYRRLRN